jgi:HK97 gp10 family phage protein
MSLKVTKNTIRQGVAKAREGMNENIIDALVAGEKVAKASIARGTPVDTSRTVNSIRAESGRAIRGGKLTKRLRKNLPAGKDVVRFIEVVNGKISLVFGTNVPYTPFIEFGTSRQKAQPFFSNGLKNAERSVAAAMRSKIKID